MAEKDENQAARRLSEKGQTRLQLEEKSQTMSELEEKGQTMPELEEKGQTMPELEEKGQTMPELEEKGQTRLELEEKGQTRLELDGNGQTIPGLEDDSETETQPAQERTVKSPSDDDDDDTDDVPYDRGWAWMVLLGSVINYGLISAYVKTMGVYFVELLHYFEAPASYTALLFAIRGGVFSIAGMYTMNVVIGRLGCRKTSLIGAVLMSLGAILSSLANDLILLICIQAVLIGVADAMLGPTGEVLTARYFRKRRFLAMAIIKASSSVASIAYPPLLAYLLAQYGLRGALFLSGGLSLHALPAALLLRPPSYFRKKRFRTQCPAGHGEGWQLSAERLNNYSDATKQHKCFEKTITEYDTENETHNIKDKDEDLKRALVSETDDSFKSVVVVEDEETSFVHTEDQGANNKATTDTTYKNPENAQGLQESKALLEQNSCHPKSVNRTEKTSCCVQATDDRIQDDKRRQPLLQRLKATLWVLDFSLFRRPSFTLLLIYYMLSPNINVGLDYLPALAEQQGMSKVQAAHLLSIVGALDLVSRLSVGLVANLQIVQVPVLAGVALTGLGTVYQCARWLTSFELLVALSVAQGILAGVVNALTSLIILHVVGLTQLAKGIGFQFLAEGAFSSAFHPLMGYIRDRTGSYVEVYHVTGCCLLAAALVLLCEEVLRKREKRQEIVLTT